jgi:hydroxyacylglutathione hydrolase
MLVFKFACGPFHTNAILLVCDKKKKCVVIDPSAGSAPLLLGKIAELGLSLEKILLTHSHWDHFADAFELKEKTKVSLYVHSLDAANLTAPGSDRVPSPISIHPVEPDGFLTEGDVIFVGDLKIEVIHTPGHSPGCVCFYLPENHILFSGDTLFKGAMGALYLPTAQPSKMSLSLAKLAKLPSSTRVVPGHGADTSIGEEKWLC